MANDAGLRLAGPFLKLRLHVAQRSDHGWFLRFRLKNFPSGRDRLAVGIGLGNTDLALRNDRRPASLQGTGNHSVRRREAAPAPPRGSPWPPRARWWSEVQHSGVASERSPLIH